MDDTVNNNHSIRACRWCLAWLICALALTSGCTHHTTHWQEDVQLSDGSVLTVDRSSAYELRSQIGGPSGWAHIQEELAFKDPKTGDKVLWQASLRSAAFVDLINGRYWLVASSPGCFMDLKGQRVLQVYVLDGSDWTRVEPEQAPPIAAPNLVWRPSYVDSRRWDHLSLKLKREIEDAIAKRWAPPEYRSFDLINSPRC
jgi:hypothetical protein